MPRDQSSQRMFRLVAFTIVTVVITVQAAYAGWALHNGNIHEMWYFIGGMVFVGGGIGLFMAFVEIVIFGGEPDAA